MSYEPHSLLISLFNELEPMLRRLTVKFNLSQDLHQQGIEILVYKVQHSVNLFQRLPGDSYQIVTNN